MNNNYILQQCFGMQCMQKCVIYQPFCPLLVLSLEKEVRRERMGRKCSSLQAAPLIASLKQNGSNHLLINVKKYVQRCIGNVSTLNPRSGSR